jgi:tetratricopeptide (TPR) repeat protein
MSTVLLVGGCSDDEDRPSDAGSESASPSGTAASESPSEDDVLSAAILVEDGLDKLIVKDVATARAAFEEAAALDPGNLYAHYNLGVLAQRDLDDAAALAFYDRALAIQADYAPALFNKAIILETSDLDQSIELFRQVVELDPTMATAFMRLGFALVHQCERGEGKKLLEQGISLDPRMEKMEAPNYK